MNAPTLWDQVVAAETAIRNGQRPAADEPGFLEKRLAALQPKARVSDPVTSHEAAAVTRRGNQELVGAVRWYVSKQSEPVSAFRIADALAGARWSHATVRSAVSRAGLHATDTNGLTDRGRKCLRYVLREA